MKLSELTEGLPGQLIFDGEFRSLAFATEREQTSFLTFLEWEKFLPMLENPNISCVLTVPALADRIPAHIQGVFVCERPKTALFELHNRLSSNAEYVGISFPTRIGKDCRISPLAAVDSENVIIGDRVTIEPFAVVKGRVTIGDDVIIHSGAAIGCKGFSFSKDPQNQNISVVDTAQIILEAHVELFEQAAISTGIFPWEKTLIGENSKIDTQCFIAHGTHIGRNCLIAAGGLCCGNCRIGDHVWIGAGAVISNRVAVGDRARVSIGSVATKDVPAGETYSGNFAIPHQLFMRNLRQSLLENIDRTQMPPPPRTCRKIIFAPPYLYARHSLRKEAA